MTPGTSLSRRSPDSLAPVLGGIVSACLIFYLATFESPPISADNPWPLVADAFALALLAAAVLIWRQRRAGYVLAIVTCVIALALFGPTDLLDSLSGFADYGVFLQGILLGTGLVLMLIYAAAGLRRIARKEQGRPSRTIPGSATIALIGIGFVLGGTVIGALAAGVESRLLAVSGTSGDIAIVRGAADRNIAEPYSPRDLSVTLGTAVTWVNMDTVTHTVTSQAGGLFDSSGLSTGGTFKFTFPSTGTFPYYCAVHPWMKGAIIVTPG